MRRSTRWIGDHDSAEFGEVSGYRIVEGESMLFVQHHRRDRGDRFGHRVDAEQRALRHRRARLEILEADSLHITEATVPRDGSYSTGDLMFADITVQQVGSFVETRGSKADGLRIHAGASGLLRTDADDEH